MISGVAFCIIYIELSNCIELSIKAGIAMSYEDLEKKLAPFQIKNAEKVRLAAIGKLPAKLRKTSRGIHGLDATGKKLKGWEKVQKAQGEAFQELDSMTAANRTKVFNGMFPQLGAYVEAGWQLLKTLPYQDDYVRKPFRAPGDPGLTLERRSQWVGELLQLTQPYDQPVTFYATHGAWLAEVHYADRELGVLLAAVISQNTEEAAAVYEILRAGASGEHETAAMGHHVNYAFLLSSREEAWTYMEKMLLAAQRQEGLRQSILETIDEANTGAFERMVKLMLDENLVRFAATVRAVDVWLGLMWDSASTGVIKKQLTQVLLFLTSETDRKKALAGDDASAVYTALWVRAFRDVTPAIAEARKLLKSKDAEVRFAAAALLQRTGVDDACTALLPALADDDLRVAALALQAFGVNDDFSSRHPQVDVFEKIEQLLTRVTKKKETFKPLLWPWYEITLSRQYVVQTLMEYRGKRKIDSLFPYIRDMDQYMRADMARQMGKRKNISGQARSTLLELGGDSASYVRDEAFKAIGKLKLTDEEAEDIEGFLTRKSADLRSGVYQVLLGRGINNALQSASRLLESRSAAQRSAGLEMLLQLIQEQRSEEKCRAMCQAFVAGRKKLTADEKKMVDTISDSGREVPTLDNALGLMDPAARATIPTPQKHKVRFSSPAAVALIKSLQALIEKNKKTVVEITTWNDSVEELQLGNIQWEFPCPNISQPLEEELKRLILRPLWEEWLVSRPASTKDKDGLEFLRAVAIFNLSGASTKSTKAAVKAFGVAKCPRSKYNHIISDLLSWLAWMTLPKDAPAKLLDMVETTLAMVPEAELHRKPKKDSWSNDTWRQQEDGWMGIREMYAHIPPSHPASADRVRLWLLDRFCDEPFIEKAGQRTYMEVERQRCDFDLLVAAYEARQATDADIYDHLLGPREKSTGYYSYQDFSDLGSLTQRKPQKMLKEHPWLKPMVDAARDRVLEVEYDRSESPTESSGAARNISCVKGIDNLLKIVQCLGKEPLARSYTGSADSRKAVFSGLLRVSQPGRGDTAAKFTAAFKNSGVTQQRWFDVAFFAPQWAAHIEAATGWEGLEDAVWWIHAHTKDNQWSIDGDVRSSWEAEIRNRTRLEGEDLIDGAVDVEWFLRVYGQLKKAKWEALDKSAKYASGGGGHKRAQLFADAMLGRLTKTDLVGRINDKRNQDAVRALGLLPLAGGARREKDLLDRYKILQEFVRGSRQFGAQKQASERRAAKIGQQNLARSAGYKDPIRLQWAMEARAVADLADGPVSVTAGPTTVSLEITETGGVDLKIVKNGKQLKSVPADARKNKEVKAIRERRTELKRQISRMRPTLEQMMVRGETFTAAELKELTQHAILAPMLRRLVLIGDGVSGYPEDNGRTLVGFAGKKEPLKKDELLRIAHPWDFYSSKNWPEWQRDCFDREIIQPFKQVFRELYPLTAAEKKEKTQSRRYAGQQVNPRQAMALFGSRQWLTQPEEGVMKVFHEENIVAHVTFQEAFYTPADIDGLTIETVGFSHRGTPKVIPLAKVPPVLFSEVMRDLDLVVSVAHRGGVDPEASASTIQMRTSLVQETLQLLDIRNVKIKASHANIKGELGEYNVHLGSAVSHITGGGALPLVAVHSQHRGRMFLPFADDDPKTAEVISKILLLAQDREIKDPNLLSSIRRG